MISCSQLEEALTALKEVSGEAKVKKIVALLDTDSDGAIHLSEIAEVALSPPLTSHTLSVIVCVWLCQASNRVL